MTSRRATKGDANELDGKIARRAAPPRGAAIIPQDTVRRMGEHMLAQAREPWRRIEAELPGGVRAETRLDAGNLSLVYTFLHDEMGELGHVKAVFGGNGMSLNGLFCGVREHDDGLKTDRAEMMLDIYETAKTAFAGDGPS